MISLKCKSCGGELEILEESTVCECEFCGLKQTVPVMDDEKKIKLFDRANRLRLNCEFDKAAGVYENIVEEFPEEAEGYWGLVLCKYGIEYVDDPAGDKVPTCHRSSFDSVMEDKDLELALEYADLIAKRVYREQAKQLEEIRKGIIEVVGKEEPYDIFICYKETDENGERTVDSVMAQDIYDVLTEKGYRVFFSRISLEDKLGVEYEPFIFAALNSTKIMLAIGTDYEYYDAVWVKNEWSRFLKLMAKDKTKHLIPCYKNLDAYDIPKEFAHLQAQDLGKVGAIQDLIRGIEKILGNKKEDTKSDNSTSIIQPVVSGGPNIDALLKRGKMALEDGEWDKAQDFFDQVLNMDAECGAAHLGLYMGKNELSNEESLHQYVVQLDDFTDKAYIRMKQFANEEMLTKLKQWEQEQADRVKREEEERKRKAAEEAERKRIEKEKEAERKRIEKEKEAERKRIEKEKEAERRRIEAEEEKRRRAEYNKILHIIESGELEFTEQENEELERLKLEAEKAECDASAVESKCQTLKKALEEIETQIKNNSEYLSSLGIFKIGEKKRVEAERDSLIRRKNECLATMKSQESLVKQKRQEALRNNDIYEAELTKLTEERLDSLYRKLLCVADDEGIETILKKRPDLIDLIRKSPQLAFLIRKSPRLAILISREGDEVEFGTGKWIVLCRENNKVLMLSKFCIEKRSYNEKFESVMWEHCTLRRWLNGTYLTSAFSSDDQSRIIEASIENPDNAKYGTDGGNNTTDKVFLLSIDEVKKYFTSDSARQATLADGTSVWWWLRSSGSYSKIAAVVSSGGSVDEIGSSVNSEDGAVRPALWVDISNLES